VMHHFRLVAISLSVDIQECCSSPSIMSITYSAGEVKFRFDTFLFTFLFSRIFLISFTFLNITTIRSRRRIPENLIKPALIKFGSEISIHVRVNQIITIMISKMFHPSLRKGHPNA
jgi:hypothetical protein